MAQRTHEIHPAIVHFPLALFPVVLAADLVGRITGSQRLMDMGRTLLPVATGSAAVAAAFGFAAQQAVRAEGAAHEVLATHRNLNLSLLGITTILTVNRLQQERPSLGYLLSMLAGSVAMTYSGYLGGKMVYQHGVGVERAGGVNLERSPEIRRGRVSQAAHVTATEAAEGFVTAHEEMLQGEIAPALTKSVAKGDGAATPGP